jgi:dTDP-glucose 4,6-dehydratase
MIQSKLQKGETIQIHSSSNGEIGTRYYIHSGNTANAILFILTHIDAKQHIPGEIDKPVRLNIVGDKQVSNLELVNTISKLMGIEPKIEVVEFHQNNPGHDLHYGLNGEALKDLGWRSPLSFEESMKNTIDWQKDNPEWLAGE